MLFIQQKEQLKIFFLGLARRSKRALMLGADAIVFFTAAIFVSWVLYDTSFFSLTFILIGLTALVTTVTFSWYSGLYDTIVRYIGLDFYHKANITAITSAVITTTVVYLGVGIPPLKWGVAYWTIIVLYLCYSRFIMRNMLAQGQSLTKHERVIVYGAGSAGSQLVYCLQNSDKSVPVAFLDDDKTLHGKTANGVRIHSPSDIEAIMKAQAATKVLLAIPSASIRRRKEIVEALRCSKVQVQTIPDFRDLVSGKARVDDIQDVKLADLMGRAVVPSNPSLLHACIEGKTVLVTGAGGTIGSELCRQILTLNVRKLLLLDICEASLYRVDSELKKELQISQLNCEVISLLGSVGDVHRVTEILNTYSVQTIYHAAAYKHVPIVEHNMIDGIRNNSLGTYELALAACRAKVHTFVLVSTDKAVRPTNVMGASKRVAELALQAIQEGCKATDTRFCMVRFGNVLESSGSVVPLFRNQIRHGGPVTVTHRDIVRYFMTIQESAELVIQAGSMAEGGDVFVLDMGQPVKILELARRMILLTGMTVREDSNPEGDIEIAFTGLRPGEKLYEELLVGSDVLGTEHPRIMRAVETYIPLERFQALYSQLSAAVEVRDCVKVKQALLELVDNYQSVGGLEDHVWNDQNLLLRESGANKITSISVQRTQD